MASSPSRKDYPVVRPSPRTRPHGSNCKQTMFARRRRGGTRSRSPKIPRRSVRPPPVNYPLESVALQSHYECRDKIFEPLSSAHLRLSLCKNLTLGKHPDPWSSYKACCQISSLCTSLPLLTTARTVCSISPGYQRPSKRMRERGTPS